MPPPPPRVKLCHQHKNKVEIHIVAKCLSAMVSMQFDSVNDLRSPALCSSQINPMLLNVYVSLDILMYLSILHQNFATKHCHSHLHTRKLRILLGIINLMIITIISISIYIQSARYIKHYFSLSVPKTITFSMQFQAAIQIILSRWLPDRFI